jgi:hypothetical protein
MPVEKSLFERGLADYWREGSQAPRLLRWNTHLTRGTELHPSIIRVCNSALQQRHAQNRSHTTLPHWYAVREKKLQKKFLNYANAILVYNKMTDNIGDRGRVLGTDGFSSPRRRRFVWLELYQEFYSYPGWNTDLFCQLQLSFLCHALRNDTYIGCFSRSTDGYNSS